MMNNKNVVEYIPFKVFKKAPEQYVGLLPGKLERDVFLDKIHSQFIIKDYKKNRSGLVFHTSKIPLYDTVIDNNVYKGIIAPLNMLPHELKYDDLYFDKIFVTYGKYFVSQKQKRHFIIYDNYENAPHIFIHIYKHFMPKKLNAEAIKNNLNIKALSDMVIKQWSSYNTILKQNSFYTLIKYNMKSANFYIVMPKEQ